MSDLAETATQATIVAVALLADLAAPDSYTGFLRDPAAGRPGVDRLSRDTTDLRVIARDIQRTG